MYFYIKKLENGREALVVVEVEKRSRNSKSIWVEGYESYCIISHDERGEYILRAIIFARKRYGIVQV